MGSNHFVAGLKYRPTEFDVPSYYFADSPGGGWSVTGPHTYYRNWELTTGAVAKIGNRVWLNNDLESNDGGLTFVPSSVAFPQRTCKLASVFPQGAGMWPHLAQLTTTYGYSRSTDLGVTWSHRPLPDTVDSEGIDPDTIFWKEDGSLTFVHVGEIAGGTDGSDRGFYSFKYSAGNPLVVYTTGNQGWSWTEREVHEGGPYIAQPLHVIDPTFYACQMMYGLWACEQRHTHRSGLYLDLLGLCAWDDYTFVLAFEGWHEHRYGAVADYYWYNDWIPDAAVSAVRNFVYYPSTDLISFYCIGGNPPMWLSYRDDHWNLYPNTIGRESLGAKSTASGEGSHDCTFGADDNDTYPRGCRITLVPYSGYVYMFTQVALCQRPPTVYPTDPPHPYMSWLSMTTPAVYTSVLVIDRMPLPLGRWENVGLYELSFPWGIRGINSGDGTTCCVIGSTETGLVEIFRNGVVTLQTILTYPVALPGDTFEPVSFDVRIAHEGYGIFDSQVF